MMPPVRHLSPANRPPGHARRPARASTPALRTLTFVAGLAGTLVLGLSVPLPAHAQTGGPLGQPTAAHGAPAGGAVDARSGTQAPRGNWDYGSSRSFSSNFSQRASTPSGAASQPDRPLATPQSAPTRSGRGNPATPLDRRVVQERHEVPVLATRALQEEEVDSITHLQQLVQQATMHETGLGATRDLARAFDLYCEAAAKGFPEALVRMAWMYADGNGVEKSRAAAHTLFVRAQRFGYAQAGELAKRFAGEPEVLPMCLRGTLVERGTIERPATREEIAAFVPRASGSLRSAAMGLSGDRARFTEIVLAEARRLKIDPRLVMAVMAAESGFDPNARSPKNAHGLMQLLPETAERFNVSDINDPAQNIRGGMAYLRWLLAYFRGDVALALAGYNAGEGAVDRHNGVPPYPETLAYVQKIRAAYPFDRHPYDPTASSSPSRVAQSAAPAGSAEMAFEAATSGAARN